MPRSSSTLNALKSRSFSLSFDSKLQKSVGCWLDWGLGLRLSLDDDFDGDFINLIVGDENSDARSEGSLGMRPASDVVLFSLRDGAESRRYLNFCKLASLIAHFGQIVV